MSSVVHTSYSLTSPPPHPGSLWTRFVCVSDTHSKLFQVPPGDVLLHAGDLSSWGSHKQLYKTIEWLKTLPHELKIIIAGNHDLSLDQKLAHWDPQACEVEASRELVYSQAVRNAGIIYLEHEQVDVSLVNGIKWKIYGSPAAPLYVAGAFQYSGKEEAEAEWKQIPLDVEILLTHTPPFGVQDVTKRGKRAGCTELAAKVETLHCCRLHIFGHIHEAFGAHVKMPNVTDETSTVGLVSINAALPDSEVPIIVDIRKEV